MTIKRPHKRSSQGSFDKNGLPDAFEEFADAVFDFIRFYGWGEILDPSVYGKVKRRTTDYIYCSVVFEEGQKSYYCQRLHPIYVGIPIVQIWQNRE